MTSTVVKTADGRVRPPNAGKGRVKGVPNKTTASVKGAFVEAFEMMGGAQALLIWGKENQTDFYKLASKLIPTEVNATVANIPHEEMLEALK